MKLELGNFYVKDVKFGDTTVYANGILTINKEEALAYVMEDEHITEADIIIARPGESKRIVPIKDAVEPRCRVNGNPVFPGVTGGMTPAGDGRTHALKKY